jgi:hypothetical protein
MVMRTGCRQRQRCRPGQTMDSRSPPGRGGEAGGARTVALDSEAVRGRWQLDEWLFSASFDGDSGSWLLLHVEEVTMVRFPSLVYDNGG